MFTSRLSSDKSFYYFYYNKNLICSYNNINNKIQLYNQELSFDMYIKLNEYIINIVK